MSAAKPDAGTWALIRTIPNSAAWATVAQGGSIQDARRQYARVVDGITAELGPNLPGPFDPVDLTAIAGFYGLTTDTSPALQ